MTEKKKHTTTRRASLTKRPPRILPLDVEATGLIWCGDSCVGPLYEKPWPKNAPKICDCTGEIELFGPSNKAIVYAICQEGCGAAFPVVTPPPIPAEARR